MNQVKQNELFSLIANFFKVDVNKITWDLKREDFENWDSLAHILLLSQIEEKFQISIPIEELFSINRISDYRKYIK